MQARCQVGEIRAFELDPLATFYRAWLSAILPYLISRALLNIDCKSLWQWLACARNGLAAVLRRVYIMPCIADAQTLINVTVALTCRDSLGIVTSLPRWHGLRLNGSEVFGRHTYPIVHALSLLTTNGCEFSVGLASLKPAESSSKMAHLLS